MLRMILCCTLPPVVGSCGQTGGHSAPSRPAARRRKGNKASCSEDFCGRRTSLRTGDVRHLAVSQFRMRPAVVPSAHVPTDRRCGLPRICGRRKTLFNRVLFLHPLVRSLSYSIGHIKAGEKGFISTPIFDRMWKESGNTDAELRKLELMLMDNPKAGDAIKGTAGLRKVRWGRPGRGKSGGVRVGYLDLPDRSWTYLIIAV